MTLVLQPPWCLLLDPSLTSRSGHHFNAAVRLIAAAQASGLNTVPLISVKADDAVLDSTGGTRTFVTNAYSRRRWNNREFTRQAKRIARDLILATGVAHPPPRLIIIPTCSQVIALAVALYVEWTRPVLIPKIILWLLHPPKHTGTSDDSEAEAQAAEYRHAFARLRIAVVDASNIIAFSETDALAALYTDLTGVSVGIMRSPTVIDDFMEPRRKSDTSGVTVLCAGQANIGKGYDLLPDVVRRVLSIRPDIQFNIHAAGKHLDGSVIRNLELLSEQSAGVQFSKEDLPSETYRQLMRGADLVVLPYDPNVYGKRGSGLFTEAEEMGIPVVAPNACEFARCAILEGRAVGIETYDSDSIAQAVLKALQQLEQIQTNCSAFAVSHWDDRRRVEEVLQYALLTSTTVSQMSDQTRRMSSSLTYAVCFASHYYSRVESIVPGPRKINRLLRARRVKMKP